jgi:hypothetical protein
MHLGVSQLLSLGTCASLSEPVHREEVCHLLLGVLNHVSPNNIVFGEEVMDDIIL